MDAFLALLHAQTLILTDGSVQFAREAMESRLPVLLNDMADQNAKHGTLDAKNIANLRALANEVATNQPIRALSNPESDPVWHVDWKKYAEGHTWHNAAWFFAEVYLFRLVLDVTGFEVHGVDPYHCQKMAELDDPTPWRLLESAALLHDLDSPIDEKLTILIKLSLWGNKADGAYKQVKDSIRGSHATLDVDDAYLLTDHTPQVIAHLTKLDGTKPVHFINDNCGTEILLDLALADHLLTNNWCPSIILHTKAKPTYISDATPQDVVETISLMGASTRTKTVQALAARLQAHLDSGRLIPQGHEFWNQYRFYFELPEDLTVTLASAGLVISKGDANYRRFLGDRLWPATTDIATAAPFFPTSFVALRTMKSDPIVGIAPEVEAALNVEDLKWRVNGKRGVIQSVVK
ncbi:hypothetical protein Ae201684P_007265 [Aphanomyces euteiches]|uniref:Sugar phosphate phosphatase n=1 Tax=Aphanomyces euteiches TaxID=100861 RepID=A0A6G0X9B5_9STRA|nr:hypothetical protein Ae201684_007488 [Aphanomyces euteiches]KAH9101077.1 hypothetical protein Ae201684P_007265 [Aphanomyces euteiches]KAH9156818.1 hypothetical protein AeRB84_001314 [Aphanomyces euteiches]